MLLKFLATIIAVFVTVQILPGVHVENFMTIVIVSILLGVVNTFIKPVLVFLTLPATIVTLGLFLFIINALMVLLVDMFVDGFYVESFWWALAFSLIVSLVSSFLKKLND
ncbi:hypothetical protein A3B56_01850 [Candidatus Roizmanbacteria bacterium RIFCSPLOWO2_01_FULL_45_11]|uniref:Phage holin family protein n=1 Tax=Candidatus Roizmanbacteria bacterium RIFCSPLOWO2_01_FULL_45_11 TaxID=1802070 RepID=A0A1F7JF98_9BACT|nr:MAG: hypothetical protein A3B56_01850 [Candidatus Roizmanbacteria bacterium RIFCSPLOWO2_01_FULL_45_11]